MKRAYYTDKFINFLNKDKYKIFGEIISNDQFASDDLQKNTWEYEIDILKEQLSS